MLPDASPPSSVATGLPPQHDDERGRRRRPEESLYEVLVDRVNTTATVWLGSTIGCAQCHNHKYDPFTQKDYYRLLAFFHDAPTRAARRATECATRKRRWISRRPNKSNADAAHDQLIKALEATLKRQQPRSPRRKPPGNPRCAMPPSAWTTLIPTHDRSHRRVTLTKSSRRLRPRLGRQSRTDSLHDRHLHDAGRSDHRVYASKPCPIRACPKAVPAATITATSSCPAELSARGVRRRHEAADGGGTARRWRATRARPFDTIKVDDSVYRIEPRSPPRPHRAHLRAQGRRLDRRRDEGRHAPFTRQARIDRPKCNQRRPPVTGPRLAPCTTGVPFAPNTSTAPSGQGLGRFRLSVTSSNAPAHVTEIPARLRHVLSIPAAKRDREAAQRSRRSVLRRPRRCSKTNVRTLKAAASRSPISKPHQLAMQERDGFEGKKTHLLIRGSFAAKGAIIYTGVPRPPRLARVPRRNRLGLPSWLVDPANPLTPASRSIVSGSSSSAAGSSSQRRLRHAGRAPSHPELLDWLATEFVERRLEPEGADQADRHLVAYARRHASPCAPRTRSVQPPVRARSRFRLEAETSATCPSPPAACSPAVRAQRLAAAAGRHLVHALRL